MTRTTDVLIIGAGQAGLAMSRCLSDFGIEHVVLDRGAVARRTVSPGRKAWVQVVRGEVTLAGHTLREGDGAWSDAPGTIELVGRQAQTEVLTFDMG